MKAIVIKEADDALFDVLSIAYQMKGFTVGRLGPNDEENLETIKKDKPGLLLVDFQLHPVHGDQICQLVKRNFPGLKVVALSHDNQIDSAYSHFGFDDYIKMPFDLESLYIVARKYLG